MTKSAEEIKNQYFALTAEKMDTRLDNPHGIALRYISGLINVLKIRTILDVGCGVGRGVRYFLENHPDCQVKGLETVQELIEQAVKNGIPRNSLVWGSGEKLPFADKSFDAVCEFGVFHHVESPEVVVKEMMRVAKKVIFLSDSNRFGQGSGPSRFLKLLLYKTGLWRIADFIKTGGRGYKISEGDGLYYSYSVFDSCDLLSRWADRIILIPIEKKEEKHSFYNWFGPLLTSGHVLLCAIKEK